MCEAFDRLFALLEDRKCDMTVRISAEQEEKLGYIRGLRRSHSQHLESCAKLLESAIQALQRAEMALFLQVNPSGCEAFRERGKTLRLRMFFSCFPLGGGAVEPCVSGAGHQTAAAEVSGAELPLVPGPKVPASALLLRLAEAADTSHLDQVQHGYEKMEHFTAHVERQRRALMGVDFLRRKASAGLAC